MVKEFCFLSGYFACELCNILRDKTFRRFVFFLSSTTDICYNLGDLSFFVCNIFCLIEKFFANRKASTNCAEPGRNRHDRRRNPLTVSSSLESVSARRRRVCTCSSTTGNLIGDAASGRVLYGRFHIPVVVVRSCAFYFAASA